jgi:hypothetical protein
MATKSRIALPRTVARRHAVTAVAFAAALAVAACGGGGSDSGGSGAQPQSASSVPLLLSDASSQDWSSVQVTITSVVLTGSTGSTANLLTGPVTVNLEQLDDLGELLDTASLTAGTVYTGAVLTISANPGDVVLTVASDPESGLPEAAGTVIPAARTQIQGAQGPSGSRTVTVAVNFEAPFTVPAAGAPQASAIDIDFDLGHPAFIVGHVPLGGGTTIWAVNFNGPVHHRPMRDLTRLVLRHLYGTVTGISTDNSTLMLTRDRPTMPIVSPETFAATPQTLNVRADSVNGTLFYDLDAKTHSTITDFSSVAATLQGKPYVRVAMRYQQDGTLVATRVFASATFNTVFVSPEGHVVHVDNLAGSGFVVDNADGRPIRLAVDANTQFFFRAPGSAADVTPIGTGPGFLTSHSFVRGFKVHATAVDVTTVPMVAAAVDIESAPYEGRITAATAGSFTLTDVFATPADDYSVALAEIGAATPNGADPLTGNPISGFKYWDFAYPTLVTSGANAGAGFAAATGGSISFGGTAGAYYPRALSYTTWGDPANPSGWSARDAILVPTLLPRTTVASGVGAGGNAFSVVAAGGTTPVTVDFGTTTGSATLAYQVDRSGGIVTITPQDLTSAAGLAALTAGLQAGAKVQVSGVPQADGTVRAYVIDYFTGTQAQ